MEKEKDFVLLTSLLAVGIIIVTGLAVVLQRWEVLPVTIFGLIMFPLIVLQTKKKFANITENIENVVFIITLVVIAIGFIMLYKPM